MTTQTGTIRAARLTDRQALIDLSQRAHAAGDAHRRSLGVPAPTTTRPGISLATLIPTWLPLRPPSVHLVAESDGRLVGSCRAIEEPHRDDWVITELDASDGPMAAEVRWALLQALIEEGAKKNVGRYFAACSDVRENLELFGQASFMAYAQEEILYLAAASERGPRSWLRKLVAREGRSRSQSNGAREAGSPTHSTEHWGETHALDDRHVTLQPAGAPDAWHLFDLWTHATPPAIARIEGYSAADWDSVGHEAIVPRSSLSPILQITEVDAWLMPHDQRAGGFAQHGACRESPHYLRFLIRDGTDGVAFLRALLDAIGPDAATAGLLAPVRTYESTGMRAASGVGFLAIGRVTLLVREVRALVRQPAMVPAH
ncbi:MAG: hypothetical protein E6J39_03975 [Chloroflexi bacterium]|nr:MAG: hypothetical protein E6J39_03975 [Chloroflexota bacterium]